MVSSQELVFWIVAHETTPMSSAHSLFSNFGLLCKEAEGFKSVNKLGSSHLTFAALS